MKAAQLRQSILQAAVEGKLVPQNVHDEPASELLARIRKEKERLVKEGKIKKEKPLPLIAEDETPYDLPDGWVWCRLGTAVSIKSSKRIFESDYVADGIPFYRSKEIGDLSRGETIKSKFYITKDKYNEISNRFGCPQKGDLLVTSVGTIGNCWVSDGREFYYKDGNITQILATANIISDFLLLYLKSPLFFLQAIGTVSGTAYSALTIIKFNSILFPLPPLAEQQRIVAEVDELMALCDELEAAEKELDALETRFAEYLPKSILQAAVQGKLVPQNVHDEPASELLARIRQEKARLVKEGKIKKEKPLPPIAENYIPYDLPEGWVWCRLSDVGEIVGGATPLTTESAYYTEVGKGIAWITPADMKNTKNKLISRGNKDITVDGFNSCSTKMLPAGSVIFSSRAPIGLLGFAQNDLCTNQGFKSVVPFNMQMNKWVFYTLMNLTDSIVGRASGTTFLEVSGEFMRKELFPLPPLAEQQRIVAKVDELMSLCDELKAAKEIPAKTVAAQILPFSQPDEDEAKYDVGIAARGDGEELPPEALADLAKLFGEDENA